MSSSLRRRLTGCASTTAFSSESTADIYGKVPVTQLILSLADKGCEVLSIHERDESLESYYINLVGGGRK